MLACAGSRTVSGGGVYIQFGAAEGSRARRSITEKGAGSEGDGQGARDGRRGQAPGRLRQRAATAVVQFAAEVNPARTSSLTALPLGGR